MIGTPTQWLGNRPSTGGCSWGRCRRCGCRSASRWPHPPWWEVVVSTVYMSFFILPLRGGGRPVAARPGDWKAFVRRFVGLSFAALAIYAVLPAAPPWAAARVEPGDITGGPADPPCMFRPGPGRRRRTAGPRGDDARRRPRLRRADLHPRLQIPCTSTSTRALLDEGQASVNLVAAIPSLHAGPVGDDRGVPVEHGGRAGGVHCWRATC